MKDLLLLDYETTGFSVGRGHEGIQLAAVRLDGSTLVELASFSTYIRPENPHLASAPALAVTGACLKSLALAPPSRLVLTMFEEALFSPGEDPAEACMAIAHNAGFDRRFHRLLLERAGCENSRHGEFLYCSMKYLRAVSRKWKMPLGSSGMSLDALVKDAGLPGRGDHDALEDVRIVADVLRFTRRYIPVGEIATANKMWGGCYTEDPKKNKWQEYRLGKMPHQGYNEVSIFNWSKMSKRLFLIDASNVLHRYYHAMKDRPRLNAAGQDISVVGGVLGFLERILADHQPDALAWVEDAGDSGRGKIDPNYKSARIRLDGEEKEKFRASERLIKEVLEAMRIPILQVAGFEADDVMATMACRVAEKGWTAVIVGHDKDMYQVVSERIHILVPGRSGKTPVPDRLVTPENAAERLGVPPHQVVDYLSLVGDGADTVPGVKGIGEKGAVELLKQFGSLAAILDRVQEVSSKRYRVALENQAEQARRCGDLVRLILDVPVPFGRDLRVWSRDSARFSEVCQRLGIKQKEEGMWARTRGEPAPPAKPSAARTL